jgi:hypothetical protein
MPDKRSSKRPALDVLAFLHSAGITPRVLTLPISVVPARLRAPDVRPVYFGTAAARRCEYTASMTREHYQRFLSSVWFLTICIAGAAAGLQSPGILTAAIVVAIGPPVLMQLVWRDPAQTMSEIIQEARR